jgi:hypothetical protein
MHGGQCCPVSHGRRDAKKSTTGSAKYGVDGSESVSVAFAGARSNIGERFALEGSLHKMPQEMVVVLSERLVVMVERGFS